MHMLQEKLITFKNKKCFKIRHNFFKTSFSPSTIIEWNSKSFVVFKNSILKFIRPFASNFFNCDNHKGIRLIARPRVVMSYLLEHEHKFMCNFQDCLNSICSCGLDIESTSHTLLQCPIFDDERYTLLNILNKIDCKLQELTNSSLSQTLLYGNTLFVKEKNRIILNAPIEYILSTERF